jgi:ABC-type transport system involved in multi-copper enzyme maturation permease subunit
MARRWGLGPVFAYESLINARRWQVYAGRALLVGSLLVAMMLVWLNRAGRTEFRSLAELARFGQVVFMAIMGTELVLVLMVAPAAAAGAICQDKTRGTLTHLLLTDLSDSEIVLGKLAARLVTVLGIVACTLPVLALATLMGGVDPNALVGGSLVIVAVAILSVAVALTFSVWASKAHEALMAT